MPEHERQNSGHPRLTVACVLRSGGIYDAFHVNRLRIHVARHLRQPYRFVCLTDKPVPRIDCIPLVNDWPGWWAKLELFRPDALTGRVLYFDLDVSIVDSIDALADFPADFAAIKDYQFPLQLNSSVMAWDSGYADHLYNEFVPVAAETMKRLHGDQNWIFERTPMAARFPRQWCPSYRGHLAPNGGALTWGARVVVFHGKPKPWDMPPGHWAHGLTETITYA
jgi:hypothetical protein